MGRIALQRRVVVTGIGIVSPLGNDPVTFFDALAAGTSGIRLLDPPASLSATSALASKRHVAGSVPFDGAAHFAPPRLRMLDRVAQFALVAAAQAVAWMPPLPSARRWTSRREMRREPAHLRWRLRAGSGQRWATHLP